MNDFTKEQIDDFVEKYSKANKDLVYKIINEYFDNPVDYKKLYPKYIINTERIAGK